MKRVKKLTSSTLFIFSCFILASCSNTVVNNSSVPEYEGMTISNGSFNLNEKVNRRSTIKNLDTTDSSEMTDVPEYDEHESEDDTLEEDIEDLVTIDVQTDDEVKYYIKPNDTFIIEIHLSNPNQYEIQSFTLNGKKYSNYMFKDGSTMELLLLETTAPSTPGYFEYTIDAIKYIDGTDIKDVKMSGDKTIKTGIEYQSAPTAKITSQNVSTTYIDLGVNVSDQFSLIDSESLQIYLSDGKTLIDKKSLNVGDNNITFNNLEAHTLYEYGIAATFDLVDGRDLHSEWLLKNTFETEGIYSIDNIQKTKTSISFDVNKNGQVGEIDNISLYDNSNGKLVASGDSSTRSFDNLLSNHTYRLYVDFSYYKNDIKIADWVGEDITTIAKAEPEIVITDISSDKTSVSYKVNLNDVDGISSIDKVELLKNGSVVNSNNGLKEGTFTGLLSNNSYDIRVSYSYDLNDGKGIINSSVEKSITTIAKAEPEIVITDVSSDKTSVSYKVNLNDVDGISSIDKVELLKNGSVVNSNNGLKEGTFTGLLSNNSYDIRVSYSYDLNDGKGIINSSVEKSITTIAKAEPEIVITDEQITDSFIGANLSFIDQDSVGILNTVELYKDGKLVSSNTSKKINFTGLDYYTDYKVVINYSYDLNDGIGMIDANYEINYKTSPYIEFKSCEIINTSAVSEGETIYMEAKLDNPLGAMPQSVVVNGQEYSCTNSTSPNRIYIEIVNDGQFEGGDTVLSIEKLNMSLDGKTYSIIPESNNFDNVFVNGSLTIKSVKLVNSEGKDVQYSTQDNVYFEIRLGNKTGYEINKIVIDNIEHTDFIEIDSETYRIKMNDYYGWRSFTLNSISYSNQYISKTLTADFKSNYLYVLPHSQITKINDAEDLLSTDFSYGGIFSLQNDINLSGYEWTNLGDFNGVFLGNGHTISNMTNVSTVYNSAVNIGLFQNLNGVVDGLNISDARILINQRTDDMNNKDDVHVGLLACTTSAQVSITNCGVSGDIQVSNNYTGESECNYRLGGLLAEINYCDSAYIDNCSVNVSINNLDETIIYNRSYTAPIIGQIWANDYVNITIQNRKISGSIFSNCVAHSGLIYGEIGFSSDKHFLHFINVDVDLNLNGSYVRKTINFDGTAVEFLSYSLYE